MKFGKRKKLVVLAMACLCVMGAVAVSGKSANAKTMLPSSEVKISKTALTMYPNTTAQLKVTGAGEKVKWSSTDNKIVSILGGKGKYQNTVAIRTKNKTGTCKIKAKVKGKTYTCKVTVKKDSKVSRVKLVKVNKTSKQIQVKVKICNRSGKRNWYGHSYTVEKFVDGAWKQIGPSDIAFNMEAIGIPAHSTMDMTYVVSNGIGMEKFGKGVYRLMVNVTGMKYAYALFTL